MIWGKEGVGSLGTGPGESRSWVMASLGSAALFDSCCLSRPVIQPFGGPTSASRCADLVWPEGCPCLGTPSPLTHQGGGCHGGLSWALGLPPAPASLELTLQ